MAYARRWAAGFNDLGLAGGTPADSAFLNAVEAALLALFDANPGSAGMVPVWTPAGTHYVPQLITNASIDPAAAIAKSKLAALNITDADVAGAAAIAKSKLSLANSITDADINAAAAIALSKLAGYPADATKFARGDGTWAAPTSPMTLIQEQIVTGSVAASITFSAIPGTYRKLMLQWIARGDAAVAYTTLSMRHNGDSTAVYDGARLAYNISTGVSNSAWASSTSHELGFASGASATAGYFSSGEAHFPYYAETGTIPKDFHAESNIDTTGIGDRMYGLNSHGMWRPAAATAITSIFLFLATGNFAIGTKFALYGIL